MKELQVVIEYTKNLNVLYVEDEEMIREATRELLTVYFHNVGVI